MEGIVEAHLRQGFILRGSKYPTFEVSGPKNHALHGFGDQSTLILGTWTLWDCN